MNKDDLNAYERLKTLHKKIYEVLQIIYGFELRNDRESEKYNETLALLKELELEERKIYNQIFKNYAHVKYFSELLKKESGTLSGITLVTAPILERDQAKFARINNEICWRFRTMSCITPKSHIRNSKTGLFLSDKEVKDLRYKEAIRKYCIIDIMRISLAIFIGEMPAKSSALFLWAKNNIYYLLPDLEVEAIPIKMDPLANIRSTYNVVNYFFRNVEKRDIDVNAIKNSSVFANSFKKLLDFNDEALTNSYCFVEAKYLVSLMSASILLLPSSDAEQLIAEINMKINQLLSACNKKMIVKLLQEVVDNVEKYRNRLEKVSMTL